MLCAVIVVVASFFIFYWNRLLGWLVALLIRTLYWKQYNIWVECGEFSYSCVVPYGFLTSRLEP